MIIEVHHRIQLSSIAHRGVSPEQLVHTIRKPIFEVQEKKKSLATFSRVLSSFKFEVNFKFEVSAILN